MRGRRAFAVPVGLLLALAGGMCSNPAQASASAYQMSFRSLPGFHPPRVTLTEDSDTTSGDIFLTPRHSFQRYVPIQRGPEILDNQGRLVWFHPLTGASTNLEVQSYQGQPVLTWWQTAGSGQAEDVIYNSSYQPLALLHAPGVWTDSHEFQITPQGTALVVGQRPVPADLRAVHGPARGTVEDDLIDELDIKTGRLLWTWHSVGHVPITDTYTRPWGSRTLDYFHLNSVQQLPDGNLVISARHTWAIYEINKTTGNVIWRLGGKRSSFRMGPGTRFSWQHDAHLEGTELSLFDDASNGPNQQEGQSSGKLLRLNLSTHTATLEHTYTHSPALVAVSQGSAQVLPNRDLFIGWGSDPDFSEYSPAGQLLLEGSFVLGVNTYRAYRFPWAGQPLTPPALAVVPGSGYTTVYASWNGATRVARWRVLAGATPSMLVLIAGAPRTGFETTIPIESSLPYWEVQALDSNGHVLGSSPVRAR